MSWCDNGIGSDVCWSGDICSCCVEDDWVCWGWKGKIFKECCMERMWELSESSLALWALGLTKGCIQLLSSRDMMEERNGPEFVFGWSKTDFNKILKKERVLNMEIQIH